MIESNFVQRMLNATNTVMSFILPFTTAVPVSLSRDTESSHSLHRSLSRRHHTNSYTQYNEAGVDVILSIPTSPPTRKPSWVHNTTSKPRNERRQSCRRVNSRRDWSGELEESEYHLPFP